MITIGIVPVLIHFGHIAIRWYGVIVATAIAATMWLAGKEAQRRGIDSDEFSNLTFLVIPFGLVGARLFHVIDHWPDEYAANPVRVLYVWEGGLAIWGGILGVLLALVLWAKLRRRGLGVLLDSVAPAAALGMAIGRLACIITGDAMGRPTSGPFGFAYTNPQAMVPQLGIYYTPTPVFEIILLLGILAVLWRLRRLEIQGRLALPSGALFVVFLSLYSVGRFVITFWSSYQTIAFGLNQAQLISIAALAAVLLWLVSPLRRRTWTI